MRVGPLGDLVHSTIGFEALAAEAAAPSKSLTRAGRAVAGARKLRTMTGLRPRPGTSACDMFLSAAAKEVMCHVWTAPAVQEESRTFARSVRVQPCIRPRNAALMAAGPDVIR